MYLSRIGPSVDLSCCPKAIYTRVSAWKAGVLGSLLPKKLRNLVHLRDALSLALGVGFRVLYSRGRGVARIFSRPLKRKEWDLGRKMVVLLAAASVAVAMLAASGSAWGQEDAVQGDSGTSIGTSDRGDPVIKPRNPKPGEKIMDRTPTIKAKVFDRDRQLKKKHIKLLLDRNRIDRSDFTYSARKDLLKFTPDEKLSREKHTVKITAGPKSDRATRSWSFTIKR